MSTIPPQITSTLSSRAIVSIDSIVLLELPVVTNTKNHLLAVRNHKEDHCGLLQTDLQWAGFSVNLVTIEVSQRLSLN